MNRPLYCDESVWIPVADGLRQRGWTVHTARERGMLGEPDAEQLAFAVDNDWALLTFDDDFLGLVKGQGLEHRGLLYLDTAGLRIGDAVKRIDAHLESVSGDVAGVRYP